MDYKWTVLYNEIENFEREQELRKHPYIHIYIL